MLGGPVWRRQGCAILSAVEGQRTAIVTGAASGIGAAVAARLRGSGWRVIGLDRSHGVDVVGDAADASVLGEALSHAGERLDGLVCSAGLPPSGPWDSREHWDELLRVNLTAPYEAFRACHAGAGRRRGGGGLRREHRRRGRGVATFARLRRLARRAGGDGALAGAHRRGRRRARERGRRGRGGYAVRRASWPRPTTGRTCHWAGWRRRTRWRRWWSSYWGSTRPTSRARSGGSTGAGRCSRGSTSGTAEGSEECGRCLRWAQRSGSWHGRSSRWTGLLSASRWLRWRCLMAPMSRAASIESAGSGRRSSSGRSVRNRTALMGRRTSEVFTCDSQSR